MWRELFATLLITTTLQAQDSTPQAGTQVSSPEVEFRAAYSALRQGTAEPIAVLLTGSCQPMVTSYFASSVHPLFVELRGGSGGIYIGNQHFRHTHKQRFAFSTEAIQVIACGADIEIDVYAHLSAAPGLHMIRGKLIWQTVSDAGLGPVEERDVVLPIFVVDQNAKVAKTVGYPFHHVPLWLDVVGLIVAAPLFIPLLIACSVTGSECL